MKQKEKSTGRVKEKVAGSVAKGIVLAQVKWAGFMKKACSKLSIAAQKRWLIAFTICFGSYCTYLVFDGLLRSSEKTVQTPSAIRFPRLQEEERTVRGHPDSLILKTVRAFYHTRDSLMQVDPQQWQWILNNRQGLLDSLKQLELYIQNNGLYQP
ncbi:MAG: hypothetical protein J0I32_20190 [Sphingobacteriales bacterium]|nr:hypothetical protein [Sphingobacteriales bacterium]OJV98828.1 MAG: hypothetical protein BGO52_08655 [Sphingobacteriales bacterium 44-61]